MGYRAERSKVGTARVVGLGVGQGEWGIVTRLVLGYTEGGGSERIRGQGGHSGGRHGSGGCSHAGGSWSSGDLSVCEWSSGGTVAHGAAFGCGNVLSGDMFSGAALWTAVLGTARSGHGAGHSAPDWRATVAQGWCLRS